VTVRPEADADRDAIAAVNTAAFGQPDEARLVEAIRTSDRFVPELSLVAVADGRVVGHILVSYVDLIGDDVRGVLQLAPMAVAPERQSQGIGGALVRAALAAADRLGELLVVVVGHPMYYPRFGFEPAERFGIEPPEPLPAGVFMVAPLAAYDPAVRGRVRYPPAFDSVA
jgi:putative acetyltransferase